MRLQAERLDRSLSLQVLLHQAQHVGIAAPRLQAHRSRTRQQPARPDPAQRREQRDGQRHLRVQREQRKAQQHQAHRGAENDRQRAHDQVFHGGQVGGETRHQVACAHRGEVADRQALQVREQALANAAQDGRAQSRIQVIAPDHRGRHQHQARRHQQHYLQQQCAIRRHDGLVDQDLQAQRQRRLIGHVDQQAEHHVEHQTLVRREEFANLEQETAQAHVPHSLPPVVRPQPAAAVIPYAVPASLRSSARPSAPSTNSSSNAQTSKRLRLPLATGPQHWVSSGQCSPSTMSTACSMLTG